MARRCEHWLKTYIEWLSPQSISPESMITFSGLFTLACALRRHVKVGKEYLGGWECYPHLFLGFVSPPGVATKSTTIDKADGDLLQHILGLNRIGGTFTTPVIIDKLAKSNESSLYINGSELGMIVEKAGSSIFSILIDLFDGRKKIEDSTMTREYVFATNPCVNFIFGTTSEWIGENMTAGQLGGGFGSRVLWLHEKEPRHYRLIHKRYQDAETIARLPELHEDLLIDLLHISSNLHGEIHMDKSTYEWFDDWYVANAIPKTDNERKIKGYVNRRPAYVMKLAMLFHFCYSDTIELTITDLQWAISTLQSIEVKISDTFRYVGKAKYVADIEGIEKYVNDHYKKEGKVKYSKVFDEFQASADPEMLKSLIDANCVMDRLKLTLEDGIAYIYPFNAKVA